MAMHLAPQGASYTMQSLQETTWREFSQCLSQHELQAQLPRKEKIIFYKYNSLKIMQ